MAISILAAYSSGETAFVALSTATSGSGRPLGSRNWTTPVPKAACGWASVAQSGGAPTENLPCGSRQVSNVSGVAAGGGVTVWPSSAGDGFAAGTAGVGG